MGTKLLKDCHILIVEDDFYQALDIRNSLQSEGAKIVACRATVPDLDELMARGKIDIALLDINLGDVQSFDFARVLGGKGIPCVFLTGYDLTIVPEDVRYAKFITKPADVSTVIAALQQVHIDNDQTGNQGNQPARS